MSTTENQQSETLPLEQLRDLYERIPFVRGRARVALLHRLQRVSLEVRRARVRKAAVPGPGAAGEAADDAAVR